MQARAPWIWTSGYDYLAHVWLEGPLRIGEDALRPWTQEMALGLPALSRQAAALMECLDDPADLQAARQDFQACVKLPVPGRYVPPYSSAYLDPSQLLWGVVTTQVLSWYGEEGLDWVGQSQRYPWVRAPDHLGVECAFAAELWAASDRGEPRNMALAHTFVAGHMLQWVLRYAEDLRSRVTSSYWQGMTRFLEAWVEENAIRVPG